ncbi:MAG TPA: hypothetical protein VNO50_19620 [Pyrinomonadaceae bacterium]|nr:hypothetical protein [Pyrinomonadaceae bacterium]
MSLNLNASSPSAYIDAVNDSRFVRTFGVIALLGSIFIFIGGGIAIGIGLAVMGFGSGRYYRTLGFAVVILAILGFFLEPFRIIASMSLAAGVAWKGKTVLNTLAVEGKEDADWQVTRKRAITGIVLCIAGVVISLAWLGLSLVGLFVG